MRSADAPAHGAVGLDCFTANSKQQGVCACDVVEQFISFIGHVSAAGFMAFLAAPPPPPPTHTSSPLSHSHTHTHPHTHTHTHFLANFCLHNLRLCRRRRTQTLLSRMYSCSSVSQSSRPLLQQLKQPHRPNSSSRGTKNPQSHQHRSTNACACWAFAARMPACRSGPPAC